MVSKICNGGASQCRIFFRLLSYYISTLNMHLDVVRFTIQSPKAQLHQIWVCSSIRFKRDFTCHLSKLLLLYLANPPTNKTFSNMLQKPIKFIVPYFLVEHQRPIPWQLSPHSESAQKNFLQRNKMQDC